MPADAAALQSTEDTISIAQPARGGSRRGILLLGEHITGVLLGYWGIDLKHMFCHVEGMIDQTHSPFQVKHCGAMVSVIPPYLDCSIARRFNHDFTLLDRVPKGLVS